MDKLLFEEKNIEKGHNAVMLGCAVIFLIVAILILVIMDSMGILICDSNLVTAFVVVQIFCFIYLVYCIAAMISMNKYNIRIYERHIEGFQYAAMHENIYYLEYYKITKIQLRGSQILIHTQEKQYVHKFQNAAQIYNILMLQWNQYKFH